ncbi:MAG: T9SS type A sorting domain-containing protein [Bacteroidetes bacterium]|nr:MAG: T9SS type A sorting domain-containing protein [Bacteroidota bacterium]
MKNKSTLAQLLTAAFFLLSFSAAFSQNTWVQKADFGGTARCRAVGFSIGTKGYLGTGYDVNTWVAEKDFWELDPATNVWTQKANFGGGVRQDAVGFSIGAKGYIGTGTSGGSPVTGYQDFWEYDPSANSWMQKTDFGGGAVMRAVGFSIGAKGYIGTGSDMSFTSLGNFWEWDQASDTWTQKGNFGGMVRSDAVGFSIGNKGYIGTGTGGTQFMQDFWEWDQASNVWTQKANLGGVGRYSAVGFSIGSSGYIGVGYAGPNTPSNTGPMFPKDLWEWNQAGNSWTQRAIFSGSGRQDAVGFSVGNKGYIGTGELHVSGNYKNHLDDLWEYAPNSVSCIVTAVISSDPSSTVCVGQNVFISASGGTTYSWNTGATGANIVAAPGITTTYSVMITDAAGCTGMGTLTVPVDPGCTATGIAPLNTDALQAAIWPNPSIGEFRIGDLGLGIYNLDLYNVFGEKVHSEKILNPESQILNLDLPDGVYFMQISAIGESTSGGKTGDAILNEKIIIQK